MNHAMIDIETLSKQPNGAIISIGVAIFDDGAVVESNGWNIAPEYWHGHLDPGTIHWWAAQNEAAREFSFNGKYTDMTAAFELKSMLATHNVVEVWANDPQFDIVMLQQWWERLKNVGEFPIHYRSHRSYRTICALAEEIGGVDPRKSWAGNYVAHNPIEDAVSQARVVIASRNIIHRIPVAA